MGKPGKWGPAGVGWPLAREWEIGAHTRFVSSIPITCVVCTVTTTSKRKYQRIIVPVLAPTWVGWLGSARVWSRTQAQKGSRDRRDPTTLAFCMMARVPPTGHANPVPLDSLNFRLNGCSPCFFGDGFVPPLFGQKDKYNPARNPNI